MRKKLMNNLISIAMCTYNGERFLNEQISSILEQTYRNFELVIVDDNSKDNTINIIKEYQSKDNRIKLFQNNENIGFLERRHKVSLLKSKIIDLVDKFALI